jgi:ABC-type transport system substrate-binding protein
VALRRAIALAFDIESAIRQIYRGQASRGAVDGAARLVRARQDARGPLAEYSPARAKALLDTFGYVWTRTATDTATMPDGSRLTLEIARPPGQPGRS